MGLQHPFIPLGLSLVNGREEINGGAFPGKNDRESMNMQSLFPVFEHLQLHYARQSVSHQVWLSQIQHSATTTSALRKLPLIVMRESSDYLVASAGLEY